MSGNEITDRKVRKVVEQGKAKQILDFIRQNCPRTSSDGGSAKSGKGKKGKKGRKKQESEGDNDEVIHRSPLPILIAFSYFFFSKKNRISYFFSWHFHALLSRNDAK